MEPTEDKRFSFPNADRAIPGISGEGSPQPENDVPVRRPTVNIIDALRNQKKNDESTENIRTFQEDIASAIKSDNVSMIKVALAEKKRQESQNTLIDKEAVDQTKKYVIFGVIGLVIVLCIIGAALFTVRSLSQINEPQEQATLQPLMYTEKRVAIAIDDQDNSDITKKVKRELNDPDLELGQMKGFVFTLGTGTSTREASTPEFFEQLQSHASEDLIRALSPRFLLGIYSFNPNDFFMLIPVTSYDAAFAGMLQWEPDMENDIGSIMITRRPIVPITIGTKPKTTDVASTSASTSSAVTLAAPQIKEKIWVDRVINNKDARVMVDSDGNTAMLYVFLDKDTLLITSSDKALKEVSFRLSAGRIIR